jgi:hypothetical protein
MARDYSKYNVDGVGENLNKRKLVLRIVQDYVKKNNPSYEELKKIFPDDLQGSTGMIRNAKYDIYDDHRFFWKDVINVQDQLCVVSNQWGTDNIQQFINYAIEQLGYKISSDTRMESATEKSTKESQAMKKINITISGRITNYMFGILGDEAYAECLKAMSYAIDNDIETMAEFVKMFYQTTLYGGDGMQIFQESIDMEQFKLNCPLLSEFLDRVEEGEADHIQFYEDILDMSWEEVNIIEGDASITITVNEKEIVPQQKLADFLGETELVDEDDDQKAVAMAKTFWNENGAKFNIEDREEFTVYKAKNGVLLFNEWICPKELANYQSRERNITVEHDNIVYFDYFFEAPELDLSKIAFLQYGNASDFHRSAFEYIGSFLSYDNKIIRPDQNILRDKGFTLYYEEGFKSCSFLIVG